MDSPGTNEMSIYSGIDFGYFLYRLSSGEKVDQKFEYELDKEYRWLFFSELRYLAATSKKWETIKDMLRWKNVTTNFSITDPMPSIVPILRKTIGLYAK